MPVKPIISSKTRTIMIVGFSLLILITNVPLVHSGPTQIKTSHQATMLGQVQSPSSGLGVVNIPVYKNPVAVAYDDSNGYVYSTSTGPNQLAPGIVSVIAGTSVVANVTVGAAPLSAVYDSGNGNVYVGNYNSGTLSEISGTRVIGNITVGPFPGSLGYDSGNGYIYVVEGNKASMAPNHLIAINGTKIVANVTVGIRAIGLAYDPANGNMYLANIGPSTTSKGTVLEINGTSIVANITVGVAPVGIAYDGRDGNMYVVDEGNNPGSADLTVISGSSIVRTIKVGTVPQEAVFDNGDGQIYVSDAGLGGASANGYVFSLNGTTVTANVTVGSLPQLLAYDNGNGYVYVANFNSNTVSVLFQTSAAGFDYTLSNNGPVTVQPGTNGTTVTVTATISSGVVQPIILSCVNPLPLGISCKWNVQGSAASTQKSVLAIFVASSTPDEYVNLEVTGWPLGATTKPTIIALVVSSLKSPQTILGLDPASFYTLLGIVLGAIVITGMFEYRKTRLRKRAGTPRPI